MKDARDSGGKRGTHQRASENSVGGDLNIISYSASSGGKGALFILFFVAAAVISAGVIYVISQQGSENPLKADIVALRNGYDFYLENANEQLLAVSSAKPVKGRTIEAVQNTESEKRKWTVWDPSLDGSGSGNGDWLIEAGGRHGFIIQQGDSGESASLIQLPRRYTDGASVGSEDYSKQHWKFQPLKGAKGFYHVVANGQCLTADGKAVRAMPCEDSPIKADQAWFVGDITSQSREKECAPVGGPIFSGLCTTSVIKP